VSKVKSTFVEDVEKGMPWDEAVQKAQLDRASFAKLQKSREKAALAETVEKRYVPAVVGPKESESGLWTDQYVKKLKRKRLKRKVKRRKVAPLCIPRCPKREVQSGVETCTDQEGNLTECPYRDPLKSLPKDLPKSQTRAVLKELKKSMAELKAVKPPEPEKTVQDDVDATMKRLGYKKNGKA
jgi:hypothetical protein